MNKSRDQYMKTGRLKREIANFQTLAVEKMLDQARRKLLEPDFDNSKIIARLYKACFGDDDEMEASGEVVIPR